VASIAVAGVAKTFPNGHAAVRGVSLDIADGEFVVLVGPSGCGKSTLLRLIAGLESPSSGAIRIGGEDVTALPPQRRDLAMVFQSYALYPHLTVRENLAFGLRARKLPSATASARVREVARSLGIDELLDRRPSALSGGQRQRVALGRALVREPRAFLLDEPLSNLDPALRASTRAELSMLHRRLGATMVYVTHDQEEAMTLGSRIAVMRAGGIEQLGRPVEVYERPLNPFVARFIGSPEMNLFDGHIALEAGTVALRTGRLTMGLPAGLVDSLRLAPGQPIVAGVRPHDLEITDERPDLEGRVEVIEPLGSTTLVHVQVEDEPRRLIRVTLSPETRIAVDEPLRLRVRSGRLHVFDGASRIRIEQARPAP